MDKAIVAVSERFEIAARIKANQKSIARKLAQQVADWPKYSQAYHADSEAFADLECAALVEYFARYMELEEDKFLNLYVGEKAKQFFDPSTDEATRCRREAVLLAGERQAFLDVASTSAQYDLINSAFDKISHLLTSEAKKHVNVLFIGDCLYLDVIAFLTGPALADGLRIRPTFITSHSATEIQAQLAGLSDQNFGVVFYSPFTYALLSDYGALQRPRVLANGLGAATHIKRAVEEGLGVFETIADLFDCPIVAHLPAPILRSEGTAKEWVGSTLTLLMRRMACSRLRAELEKRAKTRIDKGQVIHLLDEEVVVGKAGLEAAGRYLYTSMLQHPAVFGEMLAAHYRDILFVIGHLIKRKLVVCDLDNTLWQGVIGEGLGVTHYYDRHKPLLDLKQRGVVLAINSKNDPAKVFWDAKDYCLSIDDFVSRQINWEPKTLNMKRIAQHLNLKEKDFVFIDDRADERSLMEEQYSEIATFDATDDRTWRILTLWAGLLPAKPGADRTEFYRQRDARQAFIAAEIENSTAEKQIAFTRLGLTLAVREAGAGDLDRVVDLINRTNQFNVTGSRVTKRQVEDWMASPTAWVLVADAGDRFGKMGTISVLIAVREPEGLTIHSFVLSCRVFGYDMEFALLEETRRLAQPGERINAPFVETPFNQPCRETYSLAGFTKVDGGWKLERAADTPISVGKWLQVTSTLR